MINVFQPSLGEEELERVREVFKSNWVGKGALTDEFENNFALHLKVGRNNVLSTNCCTEGLFTSMHIIDVKPGDEVFMPSLVLLVQATPYATVGLNWFYAMLIKER